MGRSRLSCWLAALLAAASAAPAQTPPSPAELAAYRDLHAAAARGGAEEIRRLVIGGSDPNRRDGNGRTPLHVAAFLGHREAAVALIAAKADPALLDLQRYDAVTIAAVRGDAAMVGTLIDSGASARLVTSIYDGTALIAAAHLGHAAVVRELIRGGAPLDHVNNLGWTAVIEAVILGDGGPRHIETLHALIEAGANANIADRQGVTPLQHARGRGYAAMARILEAARAR
jgi:uncharacterized protein